MRQNDTDQLYMIDANAPLFNTRFTKNRKINWSKAPFTYLERGSSIDKSAIAKICREFTQYIERISEIGYNAISLDDMAHLVAFDFYPANLKHKIASYKSLYSKFFNSAVKNNLKIFLTTDIMFFNSYIHTYTKMKHEAIIHLLNLALTRVFNEFPMIQGVIFRIGESDGIDVNSQFKSKLVIRTPNQANRYLKSLLPAFENLNRTMIIRTWTLGAFSIGDLMWNPKTFHKVFESISSDNFIISMKYGNADFHRYLQLNPLFFESPHKKIIELQTRREYEGFGEFPSFVGFDYEQYQLQLANCTSLSGIYVWCQTGGWSRFTKLTFHKNASIWNELNTIATIDIFKNQTSAETVIKKYSASHFPGKDSDQFEYFLKLSDLVVKQLWYLPEFSCQTIYFRRVRIPPLFWIFWDTIIINHLARKVIRRLVHNRDEAIREGYRALYKIKEMENIAIELGMDAEVFTFQYDTFFILALAREYFLGTWNSSIKKKIENAAQLYEKKYPWGFLIERDFSPFHIRDIIIKIGFWMCLRSQARYRLIDKIFLIKFSSWFYPLLKRIQQKRLPEVARKQAMGVQILFE